MKRCEEDRLNFIKQNSFYINYINSKLYGCRNASRKKQIFHKKKRNIGFTQWKMQNNVQGGP